MYFRDPYGVGLELYREELGSPTASGCSTGGCSSRCTPENLPDPV